MGSAQLWLTLEVQKGDPRESLHISVALVVIAALTLFPLTVRQLKPRYVFGGREAGS